jgi:hypothetical protein
MANEYLVIINGAGEYRDDFTIHRISAKTPRAAVDFLIAPENGYGKENDDGLALVTSLNSVSAFLINELRGKVSEPCMTDAVMPPVETAKGV